MKRDGLLNSGIPLGGLGTGSVELRQDGYFHEWQVMNNRPWGAGPAADIPGDAAFFALHIQGTVFGTPYLRTAVLGLPVDYQTGKFSLLGHFLNDPYHMPWLEHPEQIEAQARFPFTRLEYRFDAEAPLPVQVSLEAFSPFIPLDARNSGLPLAYFTFKLVNTSVDDLQVSLLGGLRNLTGYTYSEQPSQIRYAADEHGAWLSYSRENIPSDASDRGMMVLGVAGQGRADTSYLVHPRTSRDIWDSFHKAGRLDNQDIGDFSGTVGNMGAEFRARLRRGFPFGALCRQIDLPAGEQRMVTFVLAWHFPNFIEADYTEKQRQGTRIGHQYSLHFSNAEDVLAYALENWLTLRERTVAFFDAFYASSFPGWLLEAVTAQLTTLIKSSWWDGQGRFGIWEGLGCCGLQTTDITYYGSFPILQFFPEIQKNQMRLTRDNTETPGKIPHMMPANFSVSDVDHRGRIDLIPQYILLVWRDVLWTGDLDYAREMWPSIREALAYFTTMDTDGDGLPNNTGPDQTYDQFPLKGTSAFVGFLFAASLRAAQELARLLGDEDLARELALRLQEALQKLEAQLWIGQYYLLCYDPVEQAGNDGVMADQVNGDWFIRQTSGKGLLPDTNVRAALRSVLEFCTAPQGYIANCAWPFGGAIEIGRHTSDQANSPWSGVEYALAAHLVLMGLEEDGLRVAENVWLRYERAGLRFNHIECGANYYRALSSWAVYLALTGFAWDAVQQSLFISVSRKAHFVVCTPTGWGVVSRQGADSSIVLAVQAGEIPLRSLTVNGLRAASGLVEINGSRAAADVTVEHGAVHIRFDRPAQLLQGQRLVIWPRPRS